MPTSVAAPGPVPYGQRLRLGTSLGEYSFRCTCKRMLFHSIEGLRKVMFPMVELVNERKNLIRTHVDRLRSVDALILGSSDAVSWESIPAMIRPSREPLFHANRRGMSLSEHIPLEVSR